MARKIWLQKKQDAVKCGFSSMKGSMAYTQTEHEKNGNSESASNISFCSCTVLI